MKKFIVILGIFFLFGARYVQAELYHGIDIDAVYNSSDWSSKEKIKEIIDDYTLLLEYQNTLTLCDPKPDKSGCMNELAKEIIRHFYNGNMNNNLNIYHNFVTSISEAYGIIYCLDKYKFPAGTICNQENSVNTQKFIKQYITEMLQSIEQELIKYSFILNYRKN